jgi:hypothetical protein
MHTVHLLLMALLLMGASTAAGLPLLSTALQGMRCASCMVTGSEFSAADAREMNKCVVTRRVADGGRPMQRDVQAR